MNLTPCFRRRQRRPLVLLALLALLPAFGSAQAQGTLAERRLAITKGTAPGKVVLDLNEPAASAPAGAGSAAAATGSATAATAAATAGSAPAAPPPRSGWFSKLPPPSGRPLAVTRRFDAPDQGIVIKPAASAPAARP